jgi:DHA1 family multidrug resistance protein-like MFS transporter
LNKKLLLLVFVITFLGFIDTQLTVPIMRLYADSLGATVAIAGFIIGMYSILNTPANIVFGPVVDKFGRKIPLIIGLVGDAICMFLYSLCSTSLQLLVVRGFHGLAGAVLGLATASMVADYSPTEKRGRGMGFYAIAMGLAPLVGMMTCGIIMRNPAGFNMVFYTGSALLLAAVILAFLLPQTEAKGKAESIDFKKIGVIAARKANIASYAAIFSQWFIMGVITVLLPSYMVNLGMSAFHVAMVMLAVTATYAAFSYPAGLLSDKVGRKIPSLIGLTLLVIAINLIPMVTSFEQLIGLGMLQGIGMGCILPSALALISDNTEKGERGTAMGIFHALLTLGVAVGAPVTGVLAGRVGTSLAIHLSTLIPIAAIIAVMALVKAGLPQREAIGGGKND